MSDVVLSLNNISKAFGSTTALDDVSMRLRFGTVHALVGENGAGKTTLMRIAFGSLAPDTGTITIGDVASRSITTDAAIASGIGMVHQHFMNVPAMTVAENVALGDRGIYRSEEAAARVRDIGASTGLRLDPSARAANLPVGAQQRLEIVKALSKNARILILDEPTAVLAPNESADLLRWIRAFANDGNAVVLITHKLRDAIAVSDEITVLRRGRVALSARTVDAPLDLLTESLLGEPSTAGAEELRGRRSTTTVVARLHDVEVRDRGIIRLHRATLDVHGGQVLGIAAVEGAGQHALLRVLAGRTRPTLGRADLPASIAFIPEDRQRDALVLDFSLAENVALRDAGARRGRFSLRRLESRTQELLSTFDVRGGSPGQPACTLSGGNQQKLVLARELSARPQLVIAENPTRGLDIRATRDVLVRLRDAASDGAAVVIFSTDLDEVLGLSDRIVVVHAGVLRETAHDREIVGRAMLGVA